MKLDKLKKFMGMFGGISPPLSTLRDDFVNLSVDIVNLKAACESEMEYEIRTRTAAIFISPQIVIPPH